MNVFRVLLLCILMLLPLQASALDLPNPLGQNCKPGNETDGCVNTLTEVIVTVSVGLIGLVAVAATFMFIYGGIMMLTSGGNEKRVSQSKEILKWTTLGLVFMFLAGAILRFVYQAFKKTDYTDISASIGLGQASLSKTAVSTLNTVTGLLGIIGVTMVIWGGYQWLTAAGNEQRVERAKQILTGAIIGLVIILLSWAIVRYVILSGVNVSK